MERKIRGGTMKTIKLGNEFYVNLNSDDVKKAILDVLHHNKISKSIRDVSFDNTTKSLSIKDVCTYTYDKHLHYPHKADYIRCVYDFLRDLDKFIKK